ncbi:hypothetical protein GI482_01960 [Bacillus sp. N3536]|nr:hypothetical protein GI482_01960 [Bacillus sp. N3536]
MADVFQKSVEQFTQVHDDFIQAWNVAMSTGKTEGLEIMTQNYYVTFFNGHVERPEFFDRPEAVQGMRESVEALQGAKKRFEHRIIRQRDASRFVVFYEMIIEKNGQELTRFFTLEDWEEIKGQWLLTREITEHI